MIDGRFKGNLSALLKSGKPFAAVKLPGSKPCIITADSPEKFSITTWSGKTISLDNVECQNPYEIPDSTDVSEYLEALDKLICRLKTRRDAKTVFSRIFSYTVKNLDWIDAVGQLWDMFPDAFGYLFYTPVTGAWFGATPEVLFKVDQENRFFTHALAGTMSIDEIWDEKNRHEQQIVADYIADVLSAGGLQFTRNDTKSLVYGNIKHLCTTFEGDLPEGYPLQPLLDTLAPTPALSGFPKDAAIDDINELESHERNCYGGYMTLINENGLYCYVTIRCAHFDPESGKVAIYAGGGITPLSDPIAEEQETRHKAAAICNIITHNQY